MTKRKKTIIEEVQPDSAVSEVVIEPTEEDLRRDEEIQNFVESFGPGIGKVSIYRMNKTGRFAYIGSLPPGSVSESLIQENYGGGEFIVRLLDEGGRFLKQRSLVIEEPKKESAPGLGFGDAHRIQIEMLQQQMARQHEMLITMIQKTGNSGSSATELATALVQLRSFVKPTESKPTDSLESIRSAISLLNEGIKLAGKTSTKASDGEVKLETWRGILEAVPGVVSAMSALRLGQPGAVAQPAASSPGAAPPNPSMGQQHGIEELAFLKESFAYLKAKALAGKSVELVIDWIAENFDEPPWLPLTQRILAMPFEQLGTIDPDTQVEPLRSWFRELRDGLKRAVDERTSQVSNEGAEEEEETSKGGN